jgi:N-acetylmuramate 1-kinase
MTARYLARSGTDPEAFTYAASFLSAQRNIKILGLFARLARRDGKPAYLAHLPRVWDHLTRDLAHPGLAPLRAWVAAHVPEPDAAQRARLAAVPA